MNYLKPKVKKCVGCGGRFKRASTSYHMKDEPYKGNMICYNQKEIKQFQTKQVRNSNGGLELEKGEYTHSTYSYILWDGESYRHTDYFFCSGKCSKAFAFLCANQLHKKGAIK
tara:strand:+ start:191 stop:529 length:339 start_codon:yes stop_codon:yes gene_type:complete